MRRRDIFGANVLGGAAHPRLDAAQRRLGRLQIAPLARLDQPVVVLNRVFRVERQPQRHLTVARQFDRELDPLIAARPHLDIARILVGGEDLLEDVAEGHLAPGSPRFDIAEDPLQIADAGRQRLHLADALMHPGQELVDHLEGRAEPLLQGSLELFVDCLPHLLELRGILGTQHVQAAFNRVAQRVLLGLGLPGELRYRNTEAVPQLLKGLLHLLAQGSGVRRSLFAQQFGAQSALLPSARKLVAQHLFEALLLGGLIIAEAKKDGRRERGSEKRECETSGREQLYRHPGSRMQGPSSRGSRELSPEAVRRLSAGEHRANIGTKLNRSAGSCREIL